MNKIWLKLLISAVILIIAPTFSSCSGGSDEVETIITENDLPSAAKSFLDTYFRNIDIQKIEKENDGEIEVFVVNLVNGFEIVFNSAGQWQEVEAPYNLTVPSAIIPEPILQTLDNQYPGYGVIEINTTGQNYHIVLSNNQGGASIDLMFNQSGEIISTGDMD